MYFPGKNMSFSKILLLVGFEFHDKVNSKYKYK